MTAAERAVSRRVVARGRLTVVVLALALASGTGCTREFFREWADQDVTEAVFEKTRDPRFRMDLYSIEPPTASRFADPYDPDFPPAPPDDRAAEALSPVPQWPQFRLLSPSEGTGYLDMLEQGPRMELAQEKSPAPGYPSVVPPPPVPGPAAPAPFQPAPGAPVPGANPTPPANPPRGASPGGTANRPQVPKSGARPAVAAQARPGPNSGTAASRLTPTLSSKIPAPRPGVAAGTSPGQVKPVKLQDTGVQRAAFQAPNAPPTPPGESPAQRAAEDALLRERPVDLDPQPNQANVPDLRAPTDPRSGMSPDAYRSSGAATATLSPIFAPGATVFDEVEAAGLPPGSRPYVVDPATALQLALINNRNYQFLLEQIYQLAIPVTLNRFAFQPQFYAGMSPLQSVVLGPTGILGGASGGFASNNFANSFLYRTKETGSQTSTLSLGTAAGFGKAFSSGAKLIAGFANQVVFNFAARHGRQPTVQSVLPLTFIQPFLRGGGRAVTLEPLTLAERQLLYQIRNFIRFRQDFIPYILTQTAPFDVTAGNTPFEPSIGYLNVIQQLQNVENDRKTVAAFEQVLTQFKEMAQGGGSGVSQLNVDQINSSVQTNRQRLLTDVTQYRILLDQFKVQLGLPPDVPLVLDYGVANGFRRVFDRIDLWYAREDRLPEELPGIVAQLPTLDDVLIDGRQSVAYGSDIDHQEDVLLAAERVALENRLDLMNQRATLYDVWRTLAVNANALMGVFNVTLTNQIFTPPTTTNPFAFIEQAKQFGLVFNAELPLVRLSERNAFRQAQINYRRQQRILQDFEDNVKFQVRQDIRLLIQWAKSYEIQKEILIVNLRQKDNAQRLIFAPPGPGDAGASTQVTAQTQQLVSAQTTILGAQNNLIGFWVNYEQLRLSLYRDLGTIPYDEWEAYYEFFLTKSAAGPGGGPAAAGSRPATARASAPAGPARR
jgi:hypothetical protein